MSSRFSPGVEWELVHLGDLLGPVLNYNFGAFSGAMISIGSRGTYSLR